MFKKVLMKSGVTDLVISIIFILFGILLITQYTFIESLISIIIGAICFITGIFRIIEYASMEQRDRYLLAVGIIAIIIGLIVWFCSSAIFSLVRIVIAIWILYSGIMNLQTAIVWKEFKSKIWIFSLIIAIAIIILGMFILLNPGALSQTLGIAIIIFGVINFIENIIFIKNVKK